LRLLRYIPTGIGTLESGLSGAVSIAISTTISTIVSATGAKNGVASSTVEIGVEGMILPDSWALVSSFLTYLFIAEGTESMHARRGVVSDTQTPATEAIFTGRTSSSILTVLSLESLDFIQRHAHLSNTL